MKTRTPPGQDRPRALCRHVEEECARLGLHGPGTPPRPKFLRAWKTLGSLGLMRLSFPARYGGLAWDYARTAAVLECLGRHANFMGLPLSLGAQLWAVQSPLLEFGSEPQRTRLLPALCRGSEIGAPAVTEESAGSDILGMRCEAERIGGGYRLSGEKMFVTSAPFATLFLVWARMKGRSGPMSLACFLVPRATHRLRLRANPAEAGAPSLQLGGIRVPSAFRLGAEGQGLLIFLHAMSLERRFILAPAVGSMERRLSETIGRANSRSQFGKSIGRFQAVAHRLADMRIRLEACRGLLRRACDPGIRYNDELPSIVKSFISEAWVLNCLDSIQIHGARGCLGLPGLREELAAALSSRVLSGTNELQKNFIASRMAIEPQNSAGDPPLTN